MSVNKHYLKLKVVFFYVKKCLPPLTQFSFRKIQGRSDVQTISVVEKIVLVYQTDILI